jgi:hypothetical protein
VSYADYDLNPLRLALDLASLGEGAIGFADVAREQEIMFTDHGFPVGGGEAELTALGAAIAAALGQPDEDAFCDALAALLDTYDCRPHLTRHDGTPHLHYAPPDAPPGEWLAAIAVSGLVLYFCRNGRGRLRRCAATGCGRWLADTSRNSSRRYCSPRCASRTTVAAYRERRSR